MQNQERAVESPSTPSKLEFGSLTAKLLAELESPETQERDRRIINERNAQKVREHVQAQAAKRAALVSQIGSRYEQCTLENFEVYDDRQSTALDELTIFADHLDEHIPAGDGLALFGAFGTGKDHLLAAILFQAVDQGYSVRWVNGLAVYSQVRDQMDSEDSERSFVRALASTAVLAISDPLPPWGRLTDFQAAKLFEIIDERYRFRRATWITSNVTGGYEASDRMGGAVVDRLRERALAIHCDWPSYRARSAQ